MTGNLQERERGTGMKQKKNKKIQCGIQIFLLLFWMAAVLTGCGRREEVFLDEIQKEETAIAEDLENSEDAGNSGEAGNFKGAGNSETAGNLNKSEKSDSVEKSAGEDIEQKPDGELEVTPIPQKIFVDVCGAVLNPGVYELDAGSRIFQAVEAAGGYLPEAAASYLNRARSLADGQQIYVPTQEEIEMLAADQDETAHSFYELAPEALRQENPDVSETEGSLNGNLVNADSASRGSSSGEVSSEADSWEGKSQDTDDRINLNTADASLLSTLTGIGQSKAEAIIAYREEHGGFASIEEIMNVEGIKEGTFSKIKDKISAG